MSDSFEKLFKEPEEIRNDIISDFANDFFNEVQKLVEQHGKENFMNMLGCKMESS